MRESRTLRAMWRALETGPRHLLNGHEEGNLGYKPRRCLRAAAPVLDPTGLGNRLIVPNLHPQATGSVCHRQRLGGMLNYYYRSAA